ncbi:MAG TPA: DUF1343 domain-containing protein [Flavobacteriaceae bacterium]|nr:hypothetical protein [Flavobacteriaceae bacterium]HAT65890.1 DUF1343 domain-containing protein [Flavobacteriaceae bacterium]|tara:strand:+ start:42998 stop:44230 length:1233 start_codon:yes stop_codon:yes gene_type:complete
MVRFSFFKNTLLIILPLTMLVCFSCGGQNSEKKNENQDKQVKKQDANIVVAATQFSEYAEFLKNKKVGVVANQTSIAKDDIHLVDFLLSEGIAIQKIFSPEHGFRGSEDAGAEVKDGKDTKTGLPIFSLHGKNRKPTSEQMQGLDVMVFDIQDVGVRFYTYLSTLHYVMEACAEANIPLIVLDRPNPNAHYVDGPMMEPENTGFLGLHPVPLVYGMTIGEYAQMINGEGWLKDGIQCNLTVIPIKNYNHQSHYSLPVRPSPNLPNDVAINLYPSLGLLEGTNLNAGRGTEMQFQVIGSPYLPKDKYPFSYTPQPNFGSSNPKFKGVACHGLDLRNTPRLDNVDLTWIMDAYHNYEKKDDFFNTKNFTAHAGTTKLQKQIEAGLSMKEIRESWQRDLEQFKKVRKKYLIYE